MSHHELAFRIVGPMLVYRSGAERAGSRAGAGGYRLLDGLALTAQAAALRGCGRPEEAQVRAQRALDLHDATGYRIGADEARHELDRLAGPAPVS